MPSHKNCSDWDYSDHPKRADVATRCEQLVERCRKDAESFTKNGIDTRPWHLEVFNNMAPLTCPELVGNYRGSNIPCLKNYSVGVLSDPKVGIKPSKVKASVSQFEAQIERAIALFEKRYKDAKKSGQDGALLAQYVTLIAIVLCQFLTIHPYANGNGHMARILVFGLLGRFGYWPNVWLVDQSPNYYQALTDHRNGNPKPLVTFLLTCIKGP